MFAAGTVSSSGLRCHYSKRRRRGHYIDFGADRVVIKGVKYMSEVRGTPYIQTDVQRNTKGSEDVHRVFQHGSIATIRQQLSGR